MSLKEKQRMTQFTLRPQFACNPLCELCLQENKTVPAEDIHHIISFMSTDDPQQRLFLAYDYDNLMSLCKQCHQKIHNKL